MSSARPFPMWRRIARSFFAAFGLFALVVDSLVLTVTIRHHTADYHETLSLATEDLVREYAEFGGDAARMRESMLDDVETHGTDNLFLLISTPSGGIVAEAASNREILDQMLRRAADGAVRKYRLTARTPHRRNGLAAVRVRRTPLPDGNVLSVGCDVTGAERHTALVAVLLGVSLVVSLFIGAGAGALLARRFTAPLERIAGAAGRIAAGDNSVRVPVTAESHEISELETAFNRMAEENERTVANLRTLTDDIAHDLRTPLTRLLSAAELAATDKASAPSRAEGGPSLPLVVSEETTAMLEMINTMLEISQTDCRIDRTPREELELGEFVRHVVDLYSVLAEESGLKLSCVLPDAPVPFSAHRGKMQRLLGNLLDNAVKFTPRDGEIVVTLRERPVAISVANTGPGLSADEIPHVFKRFWRAEKCRTLPGNGLGLALVKAIATSYGGTVDCASTPNVWTTFTVSFPLSKLQ